MQEIAQKDPSNLKGAVSSFLNDCPRPGQPSHYTDEQIIKILETACRSPEDFGYEASRWSLNLLVDVVIKEGAADFISVKTVSRFLKYGEIHPPHLIRYWLHSSEKVESPETFAEKVNEICTVYHEAQTNREAGGHTISADEMTGIQAFFRHSIEEIQAAVDGAISMEQAVKLRQCLNHIDELEMHKAEIEREIFRLSDKYEEALILFEPYQDFSCWFLFLTSFGTSCKCFG